MSSEPTPAPRPFLLRFCDSFLQEGNIKWMLLAGMMILLGSSLLLVTAHWETYTPAWKYLIFLGYAAAIYGAGEWTRHRLVLVRTGTVLQVLTLLLVPITFLVLQWVGREMTGDGARGFDLRFLVINIGFAVVAALGIFHQFLRGHQPTFVICYLLLAVAGAIVPGWPEASAGPAALVLWAIFAVGSVKVNRHVFWLAEERRVPRIFGFFPIMLLGLQFLLLFALHAPRHIGLDWLGFGCVLVALPVLATADAVARVFQQRTGDLVRPLPWAIVGPLALGLALCAAGVILAGTGVLPPMKPQALVFSAALAACATAAVARRTGKQAFVWAMLACVVLAYQFSPAFFIDAAKAVLASSARVVQEERLPYAFYGLTYMPLLLAAMAGACLLERRGNGLFAQPLRQFAVGLACLMLAVSFGHPKALVPVALGMTLAFSLQVALFRERRLMFLAIAACISAAGGFASFARSALHWPLPPQAEVLCLALGAGVLLAAGFLFDPRFSRQPGARSPGLFELPCQHVSLALTLVLAVTWLALHFSMPLGSAVWPTSLVLVVLLLVQAIRWAHPVLGAGALVFGYAVIVLQALAAGMAKDSIVTVFAYVLVTQWLVSCLLARRPHTRLARVFNPAGEYLSFVLLAVGLIGAYTPVFALDMVRPFLLGDAAARLGTAVHFDWLSGLLMVVWAFAAARRQVLPVLAALACVGVLSLVTTAALTVMPMGSQAWLPAIWACTALVTLPVAELLHRRAERLSKLSPEAAAGVRALSEPLSYAVLAVLGLTAVGSLVAFPLALRVAGGVGLAGLATFSLIRQRPEIRLPALILINLQALSLTVLLVGPPLDTLLDLARHDCLPLCLPVALTAAASLLAWQVTDNTRPSPWSEVVAVHTGGLRLLLAATFGAVAVLHHGSLSMMEMLLAAASFALIAAGELYTACRRQREEHVWSALVLLALGAGFFAHLRVITVGRGTTMYALLGLGVLLWLIGAWARGQRRLDIMARPFQWTALAMPLGSVALGIARHLMQEPIWLGANSLALLLAAAFYFWRGLERNSKTFVVLSGLILNVALVLLWRELTLTDPQFFMIPIGLSVLALVQLLSREIPQKLHEPLRYLGALVILVSPTFHIVGGSWIHLFSLMVLSVGVMLIAMGLRVRALIYAGAAFLVADLVAMVVRGSIDNPNVLWIAGLVFGSAVIALAALCERNREVLLSRIRVLSETLRQWD